MALRVHRVRAIIHFQLEAQFLVHHNVLPVQPVRALECRDRVPVLCVLVLQRDQIHHVLQEQAVQVISHHVRVAHQLQVLIVQVVHQLAHQQLAVHNVQAAVHQIVVLVAAAQQEHLEKMPARAASANLNLEKRYAMNSTICKRRNWAVQLFRTVMERLQSVCVVVQHLQISLTRLAQMQPHLLQRYSTWVKWLLQHNQWMQTPLKFSVPNLDM